MHEHYTFINTVVANRTFSSVKPSIHPSNIALNANPGTVLKTACPEDFKTPPTCSNWLSFDWDKDKDQEIKDKWYDSKNFQ